MTKQEIVNWISEQIDGLEPKYMHITLRGPNVETGRYTFINELNKAPTQNISTKEAFYKFLDRPDIRTVWIYIDADSNTKGWISDGYKMCSTRLDEP